MSKEKVLSLLQKHVGKENGIRAELISRLLDMHERFVRTKISELREEGIAICGTPKTGYYIAETPEEIEEVCQFLHARAMHSLHLVSRLRKIPLPDLIGQLHLKT